MSEAQPQRNAPERTTDAAQRNAPAQIRDPGVEGVRIDPGGANRATESRDRTTVYIYLPDPGIHPTRGFFQEGL
jgi:hypothetical protein